VVSYLGPSVRERSHLSRGVSDYRTGVGVGAGAVLENSVRYRVFAGFLSRYSMSRDQSKSLWRAYLTPARMSAHNYSQEG
jgi:hypothetical protein